LRVTAVTVECSHSYPLVKVKGLNLKFRQLWRGLNEGLTSDERPRRSAWPRRREQRPVRSLAVASLVIIEDDLRVRTALTKALEQRGHVVMQAESAMAGLQLVLLHKPDVIVLDLGLPDLDGVELLRMLRPVSDAVVIVATARVSEEEIVRTLDAGADDYVTKPFSPDQLDARIRASLRRLGVVADERTRDTVVGGLRINARSREVSLDDRKIELSRKEFDLLHYLARHEGEVISKKILLAEVWNQPFFTTDKTVDVHVSWLRRKLGETADHPRYIHSVRGVGIKVVAPANS
jgi:two-component system, OmpR family, KDP operon response regulator KdpE